MLRLGLAGAGAGDGGVGGGGSGGGGGRSRGALATAPLLSAEAAVRVAIESIELGSAEGKLVNERVAAAAAERVHGVAARIRSGNFEATPGDVACTWCSFSAVCPSAFAKQPRRIAVVGRLPVSAVEAPAEALLL